MRTQFRSGMFRIFLFATLGMSLGGGSCPSFPACRNVSPADTKTFCTCSMFEPGRTADLQHPNCCMDDPVCCKEKGICRKSETNNPKCQMQATGKPLVIVPTGLVVATSQGSAFPAACEPFAVKWTYLNVGNNTATPPSSVRLAVTEEEPTDVPPAERLMSTNPAGWSSLAPCQSEDKTVNFPQGIKPNPLHTGGGYTATILVDGATSLQNGFTRFIIGFGGSSICR
jgi:hypothetical protein